VVALISAPAVVAARRAPVAHAGRPAARRFLRSGVFRDGRTCRLIATRANGQPAFGLYVRDPVTGLAHAHGMLVLTLADSRIRAMTGFDNSVLPLFGLPRTLPGHG
jgi:RNA polymerase sigma-70 factor (ECF subfamily)